MQPDRVGPYAIERRIGSGGMGTVYLGRHDGTQQLAAVKILPAELAREPGFVARFEREIDALQQLTNPHVVELYDHGGHAGTFYYAMEYVDGETLAARLRRERRVPWRESVAIAIQICAALKAAHDAGIIHRDLKPSNLLLAADDFVKLTDFGVAQVFAAGKLTRTGGIIGTAEFMSPEQARGSRATKKSDLYALGAVLYLMLTGQTPFRGKTALEVIQQHQFKPFDKPSRYIEDIPWPLEQLVCELLEKEPDKRPPDAYVLSRRLQEVLRRADVVFSEAAVGESSADGLAATVAVDKVSHEPGEATLMRDLVRAEVKRGQQRSALSSLLNNTWVLIALMVLLVAGGVWWFQGRGSPAESGAAGDPAASAAGTEGDRLLERAKHDRDVGDFARAERTARALLQMIDGLPEYDGLANRTQFFLRDLDRRRGESSGSYALLEKALNRARTLAQTGRGVAAERILSGARELYEADPQALKRVDQATREITTLEDKSGGTP